MHFASPVRLGLASAACALSLACSDDGGMIDGPDMTAGSGGSSAGTSAGGSSSAGTGTGTAGSTITAGTNSGGTAGMSGGIAGTDGMGGAGGAAIDPNGGAPSGPASGRHTARPIGSKGGNTAGYWEYLPPHYGNGALYPLLVFRHGIGENGNGTSELQKVTVNGPPKLIEADKWPEDRPFVVLSVQHTGEGCAAPKETEDFLKFALANYAIDPERVYLTGLSCGAIGSWDYLGEHTNEVIAAAVLICGNGKPAFAKAGCSLGKVPIWAFHGEADPTVDPKGSTDAIASLKACTSPAAVDARLTTYPGVGHDSWSMTYDLRNPANDIYAWLMSHKKL
jgi:predicted esterase